MLYTNIGKGQEGAWWPCVEWLSVEFTFRIKNDLKPFDKRLTIKTCNKLLVCSVVIII